MKDDAIIMFILLGLFLFFTFVATNIENDLKTIISNQNQIIEMLQPDIAIDTTFQIKKVVKPKIKVIERKVEK